MQLSPDHKPFDPVPWFANNIYQGAVARGLPVQLGNDAAEQSWAFWHANQQFDLWPRRLRTQ
jgi:hypothetical protein